MRSIGRLASGTAALLLLAPAPAEAQEAVFIVRHAEKAEPSGEDPPLSERGRLRAELLARTLEEVGLTGIYSSDLRRASDTAAPLARALGLEVELGPPREIDRLLERVRGAHPTGRVLIVGHSNTVPEIIAALGHPDPISIAEDMYDDLFVIVPRTGRPPLVMRQRLLLE